MSALELTLRGEALFLGIGKLHLLFLCPPYVSEVCVAHSKWTFSPLEGKLGDRHCCMLINLESSKQWMLELEDFPEVIWFILIFAVNMVKLAMEMTISLIKTISRTSEKESWRQGILFYSLMCQHPASRHSGNRGCEVPDLFPGRLFAHRCFHWETPVGSTASWRPSSLLPLFLAQKPDLRLVNTVIGSQQSRPHPGGACCIVIGLSQSGRSFCFHSDWSRVVHVTQPWPVTPKGNWELFPAWKNDRHPWRWILLLLLFLILNEDVLLWDTAALLEQWGGRLDGERSMLRRVGQKEREPAEELHLRAFMCSGASLQLLLCPCGNLFFRSIWPFKIT